MNRTYSMAVKVALVGLAAAGAAQAQTLNSGIDGTPGDLYLIVYNSTAKTTYVEDLGLSVTNLFSGAQVTSAVSGGTAGVVSTSSSLPAFNDTEALDSTLSTALASGSTFQWELVAVNASGSQAGAPNYALTTSNGAVSSPFTNSILQNTGVNSMALVMGNDIDTWALNETFTLNGIRTNSSFTGPRFAFPLLVLKSFRTRPTKLHWRKR